MSEVEIRHLRYFLAVAETENFTRAAERLNISQPSVSQQITQLEQTLRTPLFRRVGKRVFLTEAGTAFRKGAEVVLRKLDDACNSVGDIAGLVGGRVNLGVIPALHFGWLPRCRTPGEGIPGRHRRGAGTRVERRGNRDRGRPP